MGEEGWDQIHVKKNLRSLGKEWGNSQVYIIEKEKEREKVRYEGP